MECVGRSGWLLLLSVVVAGCGKGESADTTAATQTAGGVVINNAADPATNPIARSAAEFLDAVIKGDSARTKATLTPQAIRLIDQKGEDFSPAGLENATYQIGEVRTPTESQAIVQCVLKQVATEGNARVEEMCCLMRLVDNQWRVSGIAFSNGPGRSPMILDFESPPRQPQPPMAGATGADQGATAPAGGRPSPPRTAQETAPPRYQ